MDWELVASLHSVIHVENARWAAAALESSSGHGEVHSVIFDKSIDASSFLQFLTSVPYEFRGDILFVDNSNQAFLSSCTPKDGRVLYRFSGLDIDFYIQAKLGWTSHPAWKQTPAQASL